MIFHGLGQCFEFPSMGDRYGIRPVRKSVPFISTGSVLEQVEEEKQGGTG